LTKSSNKADIFILSRYWTYCITRGL
jgi:hypothetical protein